MKTSYLLRIAAVCALTTAGAVLAQTPPATGLKLWLKADAITGLNNGDPVSSWIDSSGNGFHATQATAANQPVFSASALNGKPAVHFLDPAGAPTGGDPTLIDHLTSSLTLNANSNSVTAIILFRSDNTGTRDTLIQPLGQGTTWLYTETNGFGGGSNFITWTFTSGRGAAGASPYIPGSWSIASVVQDATNTFTVNVYRDGVLEGGAPIGTTFAASSGGWLFGANKPKNGNGLNGYIAEVLIYEGALDQTNRLAAEQYLATKYGLSLRKNLFTENFNTADTFDVSNLPPDGQSGDLAPIATLPAYYSQQNSLSDIIEVKSGALKLSRLDNTDFGPDKRLLVTPNLNFRPYEVSGSYRVTADLSTSSADPGGDSWAGLTIGGAQLIGPVPATGFALLLRPGGGWQAFDGPNSIGFGGITGSATNYRACLEVQNNTIKVFVNGLPLDFGGGVYEHVMTNWSVANYVTLSQHSAETAVPAIGIFDNLSVSVMPEPVLPATVILADNYNTADTTNLNQSLPSRQTGTAATQGYYTAVNNDAAPGIAGNQVRITNKDNDLSVGIFWPAVDFLPYETFQSFRLRFKVTPFAPVGDPDCWAAVKLREPSPFVGVVGGEGFGILIRPSGGWQAFQGSTALGNGGVTTASTYEFDLECRTNLLKVTINGTQIMTHTMPATTSPNYVALMSFASTNRVDPPIGVGAAFDDFEFAALGTAPAVPAPTLLNPAYAAGTASFQFNSVAGVVYVVEYKDDLTWPNWAFLRNVTGNGATLTVTDSTAVSQRFYRVRKP